MRIGFKMSFMGKSFRSDDLNRAFLYPIWTLAHNPRLKEVRPR